MVSKGLGHCGTVCGANKTLARLFQHVNSALPFFSSSHVLYARRYLNCHNHSYSCQNCTYLLEQLRTRPVFAIDRRRSSGASARASFDMEAADSWAGHALSSILDINSNLYESLSY